MVAVTSVQIDQSLIFMAIISDQNFFSCHLINKVRTPTICAVKMKILIHRDRVQCQIDIACWCSWTPSTLRIDSFKSRRRRQLRGEKVDETIKNKQNRDLTLHHATNNNNNNNRSLLRSLLYIINKILLLTEQRAFLIYPRTRWCVFVLNFLKLMDLTELIGLKLHPRISNITF